MAARAAVRDTVSARLVPRGGEAARDGGWRRSDGGWAGFEAEVTPLKGWLAADAPPGSVYLALHAGVALDRVAPVALVPWSPPGRPSHGSLWPFRGTESRVFDPATGRVHLAGVVAGDDWTRGEPLDGLVDGLAHWAEPLCAGPALRDHFLGLFRTDPHVGPETLLPLAVLVRDHGPAEVYDEVVAAAARRLDDVPVPPGSPAFSGLASSSATFLAWLADRAPERPDA
ncbi:MAG TPA: hypothetical protein VFQ85_15295 [Mycobacteriales bacterium]|nr:hypothetical protein [Mycobacteriales bacterium]